MTSNISVPFFEVVNFNSVFAAASTVESLRLMVEQSSTPPPPHSPKHKGVNNGDSAAVSCKTVQAEQIIRTFIWPENLVCPSQLAQQPMASSRKLWSINHTPSAYYFVRTGEWKLDIIGLPAALFTQLRLNLEKRVNRGDASKRSQWSAMESDKD